MKLIGKILLNGLIVLFLALTAGWLVFGIVLLCLGGDVTLPGWLQGTVQSVALLYLALVAVLLVVTLGLAVVAVIRIIRRKNGRPLLTKLAVELPVALLVGVIIQLVRWWGFHQPLLPDMVALPLLFMGAVGIKNLLLAAKPAEDADASPTHPADDAPPPPVE